MFRSYFVDDVDVLKNGDLSCAFYVSSLLHIFGLIDRAHFTVDGTEFAMKNAGWVEIKKLKPGCVIFWEPIIQDGNHHRHIGFYIGENQAISNRSSLQAVGEHALHYSGLDKDNKRKKAKINRLYWHKSLV